MTLFSSSKAKRGKKPPHLFHCIMNAALNECKLADESLVTAEQEQSNLNPTADSFIFEFFKLKSDF